MDFDATLRVLASWAGRYVAVNVRPDKSEYNVVQMGGLLPNRRSEAEATGLADEAYSYRFSDMGWVTCFWLRRSEFATAVLNDRMLSIDTNGATIDIYTPATSDLTH